MESSVGYLLSRVDSVMVSRGAAGGDVRASAVLSIPPSSCPSLLALCLRASGVSILSWFVLASPRKHYRTVDKARQVSFCVIVVATLTAATSVRVGVDVC